MFTDPSGEFPIAFLIGFAIGAYLGGASSNNWDLNPGNWSLNFDTFSAMAFGGLVGGFGGQYLFGAGGVVSGGTSLNVAVGSQIGNVFNAGANFAVSNSGVMLEGLGYTTVAGGGLYISSQNYNNRFGGSGNNQSSVENKVLNEIASEQNKYYSTPELLSGKNYGIDAISGSDIQLAWMYNDVNQGRMFMWDESFTNGEPYREVCGWNTPEGLIVMNPMFNRLNESRWDWLPINVNSVRFNGNEYWINHYEHTHPFYNFGDIGVSASDAEMAKKYGCLILWNDNVWEVKTNGSYRNLFPIKKP